METPETAPETPEGFQSANEDEPPVETVHPPVKDKQDKDTASATEENEGSEDSDKGKMDVLVERVQRLYANKYYWETFKSVIIFLIGLKVAQECYHIVIPIKEYEPFRGACLGKCPRM